MAAEGKSKFVGRQAAAFLGYVQQDAERCAASCDGVEDLSAAPEEIKREILRNDAELRRREQATPGVEHDVVAIYDNAGIPSIMHRFRRVTNKELFGPAFIIGGEVYDEIYISVYKKVKKNKSASRAPAGESIEQRPEEIDEREEFGHWEGDTVYSGKGKRKTTRALLTLTERKTRKEIIIAIPNRKAETVVKALDALERKLGARRFRAIFKSITFDNGTEFAAAEGLERSCVNKRLPRTKVYFCHPYSSWERGTNENTNGMIRRRFPKGTNFAAVTNAQIAQAENWINNYPRKILGYKSSEIVFRECLRELGIAA